MEKWVLVIHIIISFVFCFFMAVTTILMFEPDRVRKIVLVVSCIATFIFSVVWHGLWDFPAVPIDPPLFFKSWHPTYNTLSSTTFLTIPVQRNVLLRSFNFFEFSNFRQSPLFITNYIIDSSRPPHTIFELIYAYHGA